MNVGYIKVKGDIITFPYGIKTIDHEVLFGMVAWDGSDYEDQLNYLQENLIELYIPDSVKSIADDTFAHCSNLRRVLISEENNLRYIEICAFFQCDSLKYFDFEFCDKLRLVDSAAFCATSITQEQLDKIPYKESVFFGERVIDKEV